MYKFADPLTLAPVINVQGCKSDLVKKSETLQLMQNLHGCANICLEW